MDNIIIPKYLKSSKCVEWRVKYDKFNILYLFIRHLFPETSKINNYRDLPNSYLKKFKLRGFQFPLNFSDIKKFLKKK